MSRSRRGRGFTLAELLVVILILGLLLGLLGPSVAAALSQAYKNNCKTNLRELARGCRNFAQDTRLHRFGKVNSLPVTPGLSSNPNWGSLTDGNSAALWQLVEHGYAGRKLLHCPGAGLYRGFDEPAGNDTAFTATTSSYSYLSMVNYGTRLYRDKPSLVILGDQNPRCELGVTGIGGADLAPNNGESSKNHGGGNEGQGVACLDTQVLWIDSPAILGDDVYASTNNNNESRGERGDRNDSFLIP